MASAPLTQWARQRTNRRAAPCYTRVSQPRPRHVTCRATLGARGGAHPLRAAAVSTSELVQETRQDSWWQRLFPGSRKSGSAEEEHIRQVTEAELLLLLADTESSSRPLVVVFSAHWCGPCKLLTKQLAMVRADMRAAGGHGADVEMVKVEAPDEDALSTRLGVYKLPCTFFVGGKGSGKPALRMEGLLSPSVIEEAVRGKSAVLGSDLKRAILL